MNTKYIETLEKEYIANHVKQQERHELIRENNIEKRDVKGYHGREIFELIQNADDAYQKSIDVGQRPHDDLQVSIIYKNHNLIVSNTGTFFDKDGVKAIVEGNNSPKTGKYLGSKGTGFRSVLNWATNIKIFSGDFAIEFSKEIAKEVFDGIKDEPQIKKQLEKRPELYIPMLAVPRNIVHDRPHELTTIEIEIDPLKLNDNYTVDRQLDEIDLKILLFMPNVASIKIETENKDILLERSIELVEECEDYRKDIVTISKIIAGKCETKEEYTLFQKVLPDAIKEGETYKEIRMAIAVPTNTEHKSKTLYTYFPLLDSVSPFNCILHATYDLGDHRNTLNKNNNNEIVAKAQLDFIIQVANKCAQDGDLAQAYRLLLPSNIASFGASMAKWEFSASFSVFQLENYYIEKLKSQKIFRTVNGRLIAITENPKLIAEAFPKIFRNESFTNLIEFSDNEERNSLIALIASKLRLDLSYSPLELCKIINGLSDKWSIQQRVKVFVWWNEWTKNKTEVPLPHLLKDSKAGTNTNTVDTGEWLVPGRTYYLLEGNVDSFKIPAWVKIPSLNIEYQNFLIAETRKKYNLKVRQQDGKSVSFIRQICNDKIFHNLDFKYRDRSNIVLTVNASVKGNYRRAVEFVKWLWKNYRDSEETSGRAAADYLNFPSKTSSVISSNKLYFTAAYGNTVAEKLFSAEDGFKPFPNPEVFSVKENQIAAFKAFVAKFGVLDFPPIVLKKIKPIPEYDAAMRKEIVASGALAYLSSQNLWKVEYELETIPALETILRNLSMCDILKWVSADSILRSYINNKHSEASKIVYQGDTQRSEHHYGGLKKNYIRFCFNKLPWIALNGEKYNPCQVLNGLVHKPNINFNSFIPVLGTKDVEKIAANLSTDFDIIRELLTIFEFPETVTHLSSQDFYGLLLMISEAENSVNFDLFRSIYRIVEQADFQKEFENSSNKTKFFSEGKLLVKHMGVTKFWPAKESYLPSSRIVNRKSVPIIDKSWRTNNDNFKRLFGCMTYSKSYTILEGREKISKLNPSFAKYFDEFIRYAGAYAEKNENVARYIEKLSVVLVESIVISEEGKQIEINDQYSLLRENITKWYIVDNEQKLNVNALSEVIESIFENIANTPKFDTGKIGELFRADDETRKFLIKKEFMTLSVIDHRYTKSRVKELFEETLLSLGCRAEDIDKYDIDYTLLDSLANAPEIIKLLQTLGLDVDSFRAAGFVYPINLTRYWRTRLSRYISDEVALFTNVMYERALNDVARQKHFIAEINRFRNFADNPDVIIPNSVKFDCVELLTHEFDDWRDCKPRYVAADEYTKNYDILNPQSLFSEKIENDIEAQRMIYFGLEQEFRAWIRKQHKAAEDKKDDEKTDLYSPFRNIVPQETNALNAAAEQAHDEREHDEAATHADDKEIKHPPTNRVYSPGAAFEKSENLAKKGAIGELLVYNALCRKYGKQAVHPRSEAFVRLGILKPGQAVSGKYDLSYTDSDGDEIMVEVKTGERGVFYMSPGELEFAENAYNDGLASKSTYKLIYVYDIDAPVPKYEVLPDAFWLKSEYHRRDIVEKIEFSF